MSRPRWRDMERKEDARLPLCLRHCCECGAVVEIRKGVVAMHQTNRMLGAYTRYGATCSGKRWRR
jgi:hypothetical protein